MQHVLVTGASRGIGRAIAVTLAAAGWHVTGTYRREDAAARAVADSIRATGGSITFYPLDVASPADIRQLLAAIPPLDALVNNAGITRDAQLIAMTGADWNAVLDTNLKGAACLCHDAAQQMSGRGRGMIVNIGSSAALSARAGQANYAAAKCGLLGLTRQLAQELAPQQLRVMMVVPGFTATDMAKAVPDALMKQTLRRIPLGRWGEPAEVAAAVAFALSDAASGFNGQLLLVDGGRTAYEREFAL